MTKKLKWRLSSLPTPDELRELVKDKLITNEEAREIMFSLEDEKERDKKSLESEIKFLRELVEKLSKGRTSIVETIRYVEKPYYQYDWYKPYAVWCGSVSAYTTGTQDLTTTSGTATYTTALNNQLSTGNSSAGFSAIKSF